MWIFTCGKIVFSTTKTRSNYFFSLIICFHPWILSIKFIFRLLRAPLKINQVFFIFPIANIRRLVNIRLSVAKFWPHQHETINFNFEPASHIISDISMTLLFLMLKWIICTLQTHMLCSHLLWQQKQESKRMGNKYILKWFQ